MNIDDVRSLGMWPVSYMSLQSSVIVSTPNSFRDFIMSTVMLSEPAAFPPFIDFIAFSTSALSIAGPSILQGFYYDVNLRCGKDLLVLHC